MGFLQGCQKGLKELKVIFNHAVVRDRLQGLALGAAAAFTFTGLNATCAGVGAGLGLLLGRRRLMAVFNTVGKYFGLKLMSDAVREDTAPVPAPTVIPPEPQPQILNLPEIKSGPSLKIDTSTLKEADIPGIFGTATTARLRRLWPAGAASTGQMAPAPWKTTYLPPAVTFQPASA